MKRVLISISGCVQGVGFRPFAYRLAQQHGLAGTIKNANNGVHLDLQGNEQALADFQAALATDKPENAVITDMLVEEAPLGSARIVQIEESDSSSEISLALMPDTALCSTCLGELYDPKNRRFRYPFLHCVSCGPRFSLFLRMPFDRSNTTMNAFPMCMECSKEYASPTDRRFYSQTNCCASCGPVLRLLANGGQQIADGHEAVDIALTYLKQGKILALKNTGGYQLLVDATDHAAILRLRALKHRGGKPFAVLMPDLAWVRPACVTTPEAESILTSPAAPIVLLNKRKGVTPLASAIAPDSPFFGIMLPHTPLHYLLLEGFAKPIVATSGNVSGRPLCIAEKEALAELSSIADVFLVHNRPIRHRLDDSIVHMIDGRPMLLRRARGYTPYTLQLPQRLHTGSKPIMAAGSHLKNSAAFAKHDKIYMTQHLGNLDSIPACLAYESDIEKWEQLLNIKPAFGIGDKHPDYYSSLYLQKRSLSFGTIQHHKAHVWACMAENRPNFPFLSFAWDGTGLGDDDTIWGGEAFAVDGDSITRIATLFPFRLPGGEKAILEPRRSALGLLHAMYGENIPHAWGPWLDASFSSEEPEILSKMVFKGVNSPICSSIGRLFDGISALLGCCLISRYEGHAALALEALAYRSDGSLADISIPWIKAEGIWMMDWRPFIARLQAEKSRGTSIETIALAFHRALAEAIVELAKKISLDDVLLTGGVMQNKLLAETTIALLRQAGFRPCWHAAIPPNDGGIAVGQIVGHAMCNLRMSVATKQWTKDDPMIFTVSLEGL